MTTLTNSFEGGSSGATITTGNSGGDSGDAWTLSSSVTGGTCTYSATGAVHGSLCMAVATAGAGGSERRGWSVNAADLSTTQHFRFYLDPATISGTVSPLRGMNLTSSGQRFRIQVTAAGVVTLHNNANSAVWTSTAISGTTRVECSIEGLTSAAGRVWIFPADGTAAAQDSGALTTNFGGPIREIWFGQTNSATNVALQLDSVGWSDTARLGPAGIRNLDLTVGAPRLGWRAGSPSPAWSTKSPAIGWRAGQPTA